VHDLLRDVTLAAGRAAIDRLAIAHGRALAAPDEERAAAADAVERALAHPMLRDRAATATDLWRELPVSQRLDDGTLVEGVVDLAFRDEDGWVVIDWKTDDARGARPLQRRQLAWYVWCVARLTGAPVRGVLFGV
jgi:ATP-dependent exoDNAse (exonuclease V) beta subunit